MRLLIVDDEDISRSGLKSLIDKERYGLDEVITADDGRSGLKLALELAPEIVLSDIRMPRMDGLSMVRQISEALPDTRFILMSGYSDREYLKEAIRLKAVSFIEKPIDEAELDQAIKEAVGESASLAISHREKAASSRHLSSRLGLLLTSAPDRRTASELKDLLPSCPGLREDLYFTTVLVKFPVSLEGSAENRLEELCSVLDKRISSLKLQELHLIRHDRYFVLHLFGEREPSRERLMDIGSFIGSHMASSPYFIAIGSSVKGMENVYRSYNSAVILMQRSFFSGNNCILIDDRDEPFPPDTVITDPTNLYRDALLSRDAERVKQKEQEIYETYKNSRSVLVNHVKDIYYRLLLCVNEAYKTLSIKADLTRESPVMELVQGSDTLDELHKLLAGLSDQLLSSIWNNELENPAVHTIRDYVSKNYSRENLSVKEISDHVRLSQTYVCTLFKNETGITLNQYITNYRINKAKQLLSDSDYKISDVSQKVGYSDGNYFGKSFKKAVGLTPSEYRDQILG